MSDEELKDMLERASKNGVELTFEEFYDIMTKKSFPWFTKNKKAFYII